MTDQGPRRRYVGAATPVGNARSDSPRSSSVEPGSEPGFDPGFDPGASLCIVSWNVHKLLHDGIHDELEDMRDLMDPDLLLLQEARCDMPVPFGLGGHHARSFRSGLANRSEEGVMTLSRVEATHAQRVRSSERELFVLTPKAALVSLFPVADGRQLCVINVHGLNFDPTGGQLARQLEALSQRVAGFDGPLIIAGDFNTWNESRMSAVMSVAAALDVTEVKPPYPGGKTGDLPSGAVSRALGFNPEMHLDRIFVRGFRAESVSWMMEYKASDHVPILARLEWA